MNGDFNTYREEKDVVPHNPKISQLYSTIVQTKQKKSGRKDKMTSKTPIATKTRRMTQKENKEVNTTDKTVKRKSALKLHLL
jgi:hypothetical protein